MGQGRPIVSSTKHKINTQSSTESEIMGVNDMMSSILWSHYFFNHRGYVVQDNIIFQDNRSTMLLERNGKALSGKTYKTYQRTIFLYHQSNFQRRSTHQMVS